MSTITPTQVFVSIKGIYYQVEVQGQTITWLTPHRFSQNVISATAFVRFGSRAA